MARDLVNPIVDLFDAAIRHRNLRLDCPRCRRVVILNGAAVWWLFESRHWPMTLSVLAGRFHCAPCRWRCRVRVRPHTSLVEQEATVHDLKLPEPREWKRAMGRCR